MAQDAKKLAYWSGHHRRWQESGLTQRRYCENEKLSFSTFDSWRVRVREANAAPAARRGSRGKLTLVAARIGDAQAKADITLRSPGGWQVTIPTALGAELLERLLARLP